MSHAEPISVSDHLAKPEFNQTAAFRLGTRLAFFAAGFAVACCAPLFPFFKADVGADKAEFGLLLLCLGLGSIVAMPISGAMAAKRGARGIVLLGGFGMIVILPLLALAHTPLLLGSALFLFGASLGTIDVSMNVHGAKIEGMEQRPLMSNFHAQFSIGGFFGAGLTTLLLYLSVPVFAAALIGAVITSVAMLLTRTRLMSAAGHMPEAFTMPRGVVLLLAALAGITFMVEGAVLDWGALLIIDLKLASTQAAGIGYILLSIAMVIGRLTGDRLVVAVGGFVVLVAGGILTIAGIAVILTSPIAWIALFGFVMIGLGAANLVPVIFSAAGRQKIMPAGLALASVTTTGYAGILLGPALIGFVADNTSLVVAFWLIAGTMLSVPLTARWVMRA